MASRIQGITIEIGGDTTKLQAALKGVDKTLKTTQGNLRDINKLLKLDPSNTELLRQKQKNLETAIKATKDRLKELKDAQSGVKEGSAEWDNLQREIIATEQQLKSLESEYKSFGSVAKQQVLAVGQNMKELGSKIQDVGHKFSPVSKAAAGLLTGMGAMGVKAVTASDDLNTLAKQSGFTTAEIQKMQYAADRIDVTFDDISGALKKMKPKMTDSNKTFESLGISVRDADGNLRSATEVFYDSVQALSQISNETERDQVAMELFGKSADSLAGIIDDGGEALKEYGDEAERLGLILDQETLDSLNATNDSLDKLKAQFKGEALKLGAKIAEAAAPLVEKLAEGMEKLSAWLDKLTPQQMEMAMKIAAIVAVAAPLLIIVGQIVSGIGGLISAFGMLLSPAGAVIAIIAALVAAGVALYKNWDKIKEFAISIWNKIEDTFTNVVDGIIQKFADLRSNISNTWNTIKANALQKVDDIKSNLVNRWNNIKNSVLNKVFELKEGIQDTFNQAKNIVSQAVERLKQILNFQWKLPHLKLPHIEVSYYPAGSVLSRFFGISSIPHLSVSWYKKAYENAVMFKSPTVLGTPYGAKGFGDGNGAEIVLGLNKLRELVGSSGDVTINVYASPDMNINQLADKIQQRFVQLQRQKEAAYA